ncbi:MAG: hypothetical protein AABW67_03930 [Nanoarchaeota archaeon]
MRKIFDTICLIMLLATCLILQGCRDDSPPEPPTAIIGQGGVISCYTSTVVVETSIGDFHTLPPNFCDYIRISGGDNYWYIISVYEGFILVDKFGRPIRQAGIPGGINVISSDDKVQYPGLNGSGRNLWNKKVPDTDFFWGDIFLYEGEFVSKSTDEYNLVSINGLSSRDGQLWFNSFIGDSNATEDNLSYTPNPAYLLPGIDWKKQQLSNWIASRVLRNFYFSSLPGGGEAGALTYLYFQKLSGQRDKRITNSTYPAGYTTTYATSATTASASTSFANINLARVADINNFFVSSSVLGSDKGIKNRQKYEKRASSKSYNISGDEKSLVQKFNTLDSNSGFSILDRFILTLDYVEDSCNPGNLILAWVPVADDEGLNVISGKKKDLATTLGNSYPYAFALEIQSVIPLHLGLKATMELQIFDSNNKIVNIMPIDLELVQLTSPTTGIALSKYWSACYDPNLQCKKTDSLGDEWTLIYMTEENHIRLSWQYPFGDFNHDKRINLFDFFAFSDAWLQDPCNIGLEFIDWSKENVLVDFGEWALFANDWRFEDPNLSRVNPYTGDLNNDGYWDSNDLLIFGSEWLQGPNLPWAHIDTTHDNNLLVNQHEFSIIANKWLCGDSNN